MLQTLLATSLVALSTRLFFRSSPIALGLIALLIAFTTGAILLSLLTSYFGMLAILVYVGGLLVTFAYFLAICPNQLIAFKTPILTFFLSLLILAPLIA